MEVYGFDTFWRCIRFGFKLSLVMAAFAAMTCAGASAQTPGVSFAGKTVQLYIGFGPGGSYDQWARTVARHLGNHLPGNPTIVAENYEGAGSLRLVNYMARSAPIDGTAIGLISREASLSNLFRLNGAQFDSRKFGWLGTPTTETSICMSYKGSSVARADDLFKKQIAVGATGFGDGTHFYPNALRELLGMKFKVVDGYSSTANVFLAMEQHELDGVCETYSSTMARRPTWISSGTVNVLFQAALQRNPALGDAPFIEDFAGDEPTKEALRLLYAGQSIGRPFLVPPSLPPEILKIQRDAFNATMRDPKFIEDAMSQKLDLQPHDGAYLDKLFAALYATPKLIIERVGRLAR